MDEREKTQAIRLIDVFAIGPLIIYAGAKSGTKLSQPVRAALIATGVATIGYNGRNYLINEKAKRLRKRRLAKQLEGIVEDTES